MVTAADQAEDPERSYPMSPEQESIWLNDQLRPGPSAYVESWAYRLRGATVVPSAVQHALNAIVARHEALRSSLTLRADGLRQAVKPPSACALDIIRVNAETLDAAIAAAATRAIPLDQPPLLRATLLEIADDDAVLVVAIHHAVIDGWCFNLLDAEFSVLYRAALTGDDALLTPLPLQFGPYARQIQESAVGNPEASLAYWRDNLTGAPAESTFPTSSPRPAELSTKGDRLQFALDALLVADIKQFARNARTTSFTVLAATLTALLSRLSGQEDVVIGTPITRRADPEAEPMIACLADVMPLRHRIDAGTTFTDLVIQMRAQVWSAIKHRDISYAQMIRELRVERSASRFPLFQVVCGMDEPGSPGLDLPGIHAERIHPRSQTAKYDVLLYLIHTPDGYDAFLDFATDLFDRDSARRLAERLQVLLRDAIAHPYRPLQYLEILSTEEQRLIQQTWAQGPAVPVETPLAHEAVTAQAMRTPNLPAVLHNDTVLTYAELNHAADVLAANLVGRGSTGRPIGVCMRRSAQCAIGILAVLKAGSTCLPIDPGYPAERIAYIVMDSGIGIALADHDLGHHLPDNIEIISPGHVASSSEMNLPAVAAADLAYLTYTSGSTGRPKGVAMPHQSLSNLIAWQTARSQLEPGARTLQFAALSFDVAFQELFSTWAAGGTLVIADDHTRLDPARLLDLLASTHVERVFLPFVALQQLAEYASSVQRKAVSLREVITAGEQLHATPAVREFFEKLAPDASLDNQYGPSETHVVTAERLSADPSDWPDLPAIGRPIDGAYVVLLDSDRRPCPVGTVGEIYIGGVPLAAGYLHRPDLTAERFVPDPLRPGELLYRTGDAARHLPDGRIQWVGRLDQQVKIRGHRVETGEVATAIQAIPGVAHAAVVAKDVGPGDRRLVAYYLPAPGSALDPESLRSLLACQLPEYMLPAGWMKLDRLPQTASGKLDISALPPLVESHAVPTAAPRNSVEVGLTKIWQDLLGTSRIGIHDDFFTLGGHSLLAIKLILRVRQQWRSVIDFSSFLKAPTVAGLAALVSSGDIGTGPAAGADLTAEITLPSDIVAAVESVEATPSPGHVLLTGATGFLGAFTLRALLDRTRATVHCLVRGEHEIVAATRLRQTLREYDIWKDRDSRRIELVLGDLAQRRLGLTESAFDELARTTEVIYHVGAAVNLTASYQHLRPATVNGTVEILRLAARSRNTPVHYISTVGVYGGDTDLPIGPGHPIGPLDALTHGYTQSKWVAEGIVELARARSLSVTTYRPTRITGDSVRGACQQSDYMWLLLKGCIQARAVPSGVNTSFDLVPVDDVSNAIVALSLRPESAGCNFHLASGRQISLGVIAQWLRNRGFDLTETSPQDFVNRVSADVDNAAFPLLGTLAMELAGPGSEGGLIFDPCSTRAALTGTGINLREVDEALFGIQVDRFVQSGWLVP
jgi:amino acid adenylation domain-containing protein/thioester reductase-like protein